MFNVPSFFEFPTWDMVDFPVQKAQVLKLTPQIHNSHLGFKWWIKFIGCACRKG